MKKVLPPTYFALFLILEIAAYFIFPAERIVPAPINLIGAIPVVFGIAFNLWADKLFKEAKTTIKPHEAPTTLITSGPFRHSRHPMYCGMAGILLGVAVFLGTGAAFLFPALFVAVIEMKFIPMEETNLQKAFGKKFSAYKAGVRRWI